MPLNDPITPALLADPEIFQQNRLPFHAHFADQTSPEMPLTVDRKSTRLNSSHSSQSRMPSSA